MVNKFSVLLSLYYRERPEYLRHSLDSLLNQTCPPDEIILVEDGPLTFELYKVLDDYEHLFKSFKRIPLTKNKGLGLALNEGLRHCSYDLVARMDTDDICFKNRFEVQAKFMMDHPEIDLCSAWIEGFINNDIHQVISTRKLPEYHDDIIKFGKIRNPISHPVCMFRKSAVEKAGGYKDCLLFEDYYLWVRMIVNGCKLYNIQRPLLYFRTSIDMYRRRGGMKYAVRETKLAWRFYKIKFISFADFVIFFITHFPVRITPQIIKKTIYTRFLR